MNNRKNVGLLQLCILALGIINNILNNNNNNNKNIITLEIINKYLIHKFLTSNKKMIKILQICIIFYKEQ